MAGYAIRIDIDQVSQIAADLENQNLKLTDELERSRQTVNRLTAENIWEGQAAEATCAAFNNFADKYFEKYHDVIDQYVRFLRNNIAQGYFETEAENSSYSDAFK